jgi:hypothetical protein
MVELSGNEVNLCDDISEGHKVNYGISLLQDLFKPLLEKDYVKEVGTPLQPLQTSQSIFMNLQAQIAIIKDDSVLEFCSVKDIVTTGLKLPAWVRTHALKSKEFATRSFNQQVHFNLVPLDGLPALKSSKLQGAQSVTVQHLVNHLVSQLNLPSERLELICKEHLLSVEAAVGSLRSLLWKQESEMIIEYRLS